MGEGGEADGGGVASNERAGKRGRERVSSRDRKRFSRRQRRERGGYNSFQVYSSAEISHALEVDEISHALEVGETYSLIGIASYYRYWLI